METWLAALEQAAATKAGIIDWEAKVPDQEAKIEEVSTLAIKTIDSLSQLVATSDGPHMSQLIEKLRDELEKSIEDQKACSAADLSKALSDFDASIRSKMIGNVFDVDPKIYTEKHKAKLHLQDYPTLDELWAVCTQEGDSRIGEAVSEAKTIDILEISDEVSCRSKTLSILTFIFETWQATRESTRSLVEKRNTKLENKAADEILKEKVRVLFWGKEVILYLQKRDSLLGKLAFGQNKATEKTVLEAFFKKKVMDDNNIELLIRSLPKYWLEKIKVNNHTKLSKLFTEIDQQVSDSTLKISSPEHIHTLLNDFATLLQKKLEKRILFDLEQCMSVIVNHFKNFKIHLEKSPPLEAMAMFEGEHVWGDRPADRCSYSKVGVIRDALVERYNEVINLDFPKVLSKTPRSAILKMWDTKQSPILLANLNHAMAVDGFIRDIVLPIKNSLLFKLGYDFDIKKLVSRLYKATLKLTLKMINATSLDTDLSLDEALYYVISLDGLHQVFIKHGFQVEIESHLVNYLHEKEKLVSRVVKKTVSPMLLTMNASLFGQDWMDFHRFSRAKKPTSPIDSVETEGLHASWLMLSARLRATAKAYLIRCVDPFFGFMPICQMYLDYFSRAYDSFTTNPVSVQRAEPFCNDLKLCIGLLEQAFSLFSNVSQAKSQEGKTIYKVKWPKKCNVDVTGFVVVYKRLQLIKSHLKVLYKTLTLTANNIDESLNELHSGLYKNRKILASFPEIYRKAYDILEFFAKEEENLQSLMQEIGQPLHSETPLIDSPRGMDMHSSSSSLIRKLRSQMSGDIEDFGSCVEMANGLFEQSIAFDASIVDVSDPEDKWLAKVSKFLAELTEEPPKLIDEFLHVCKIGKRDILLSQEESDQVSYSKKRDFFLFRPELLDKDSELSSIALATKNKVKKIF